MRITPEETREDCAEHERLAVDPGNPMVVMDRKWNAVQQMLDRIVWHLRRAFGVRPGYRLGLAISAGVVTLIGISGGALSAGLLRSPTINDSIAYEAIAAIGPKSADPFVCTGDRKYCALVTVHGDLAANTKVYTLHIFITEHLEAREAPWRVAFSTRTSRAAISQLQWTEKGLLFLGQDSAERGRVYRLDLASGKTETLTGSDLDLVGYGASSSGGRIVGAVAPDNKDVFPTLADRFRGRDADGIPLSELITGERDTTDVHAQVKTVVILSPDRSVKMTLQEPLELGRIVIMGISVSPDGRWALLEEDPPRFRWPAETWQHFKLPVGWTEAPRLRLVNLEAGTGRTFVDAPATGFWLASLDSGSLNGARSGPVIWTADGKSVITSTLLPDGLSRSPPSTLPYLIKYDLDSGAVVPMHPGMFALRQMSSGFVRAERLKLWDSQWPVGASTPDEVWLAADGSRADSPPETPHGPDCSLGIAEDSNSPPKVEFRCVEKRPKAVLDLNPQLESLALAPVTEFEFLDTDGKVRKAGLFTPPGAKAGDRRPLIIQTHGWDAGRFSLDGTEDYGLSSHAGYAAQVLAAKGYYVVQCNTFGPTYGSVEFSREAEMGARNVDAVIDVLSKRGIVDTSRLGILGWSRSGVEVRAALVRSKYNFKAAVLVDSESKSYMEYLTAENHIEFHQRDLEAMNGASPVGRAEIAKYIASSDIYSIRHPFAAVKLFAFGPLSLLWVWEDYVVYKHNGADVSLIYLPNADHDPQRPLERVAVQQGAVDWFSHYLSH